jgi:hypothetical protein
MLAAPMALARPIIDHGEQRQDIRHADRTVAQFLSDLKLAKST